MARRGLEALASVPLFQGLTTRHLRRICDIGEIADYMEGASVVRQGQEAESFFVILSGEAKVQISGRTVNRLLPGEHFGEISLLDGGERTASVVTETPVTVLQIHRSAFFKLLHDEPTIALAILRGISRMLRRTMRPLAG